MKEVMKNPFSPGVPDHRLLLESAEKMILSASGWRKVFVEDGDEESFSTVVSSTDLYLAGTAALVFLDFLRRETSKEDLNIYVGADARPTGPALMDGMNRVFLASGISVRYPALTAAPELMAAVKTDPHADGFVYISASHNPIGHNGFKFGGAGGAVFGGRKSAQLITAFKKALEDPGTMERLYSLSQALDTTAYDELLTSSLHMKQDTMDRYRSFSREVISGSREPEQQDQAFSLLKRLLRRYPVGVLGELNGSARGSSIDKDFLEDCGLLTEMHNTEPGKTVHRIVPEGSSLDLGRTLLGEAHRRNPAFVLGYVPDNDGDRGNLVYYDTRKEKAFPISAQEVFALTVLSELLFMKHIDPENTNKLAVAVNGPTSMRIEKIAQLLGAGVFRSEVGEANVVNLASRLREQGYMVRILGEGSNGGNITHPATVRDPLNTIFSILRLLIFRDDEAPYTPFREWCVQSGREEFYSPDYALEDVVAALPPFTTTSAYEPEALMKIRDTDHGRLKINYENLFLKEWKARREVLKDRFGIVQWREMNYEGTETYSGFGPQFRGKTSPGRTGGLKIIFSNSRGEDTDFIWMRGSGTEPVFRVMADSLGTDRERHDYLLQMHRNLIEKADKPSG